MSRITGKAKLFYLFEYYNKYGQMCFQKWYLYLFYKMFWSTLLKTMEGGGLNLVVCMVIISKFWPGLYLSRIELTWTSNLSKFLFLTNILYNCSTCILPIYTSCTHPHPNHPRSHIYFIFQQPHHLHFKYNWESFIQVGPREMEE